MIRLYGREALLQIGDDIVDVLGTDGKTDRRLRDTLIGELLVGELAVGRGRGMDDKALDVRDVREKGENLQIVDEGEGFFLAALDIKGKDGRAAVREVLLIQRVVGMFGKRRMVDLRDLRVMAQIFDDLLGVLRVPL